MKKAYTIGEISKLYDISTDSLRYYEEKGLIKPKRDNNDYRIYTLDNIWRLNIIKDLRKLNFSTRQIKNYLEERSASNTLKLMEKKVELIEKEIEPLIRTKNNLKQKIDHIKELKKIQKEETIEIKNIKSRKILLLEDDITDDNEVDLVFRKIEGQNDQRLFLFGNKDMGVFITKEGLEQKKYASFEKAFFIVNDQEIYNHILPCGKYLSLIYKGGYNKSQKMFDKAMNYIKSEGYKVNGQAMEIYRLDIHGTAYENEYITEIQIPIK
ncbi:MerR family transcriptional regulator [Proteinivorax hydrogeniformans]|uniref:MerR family transcriptional regulator n=1 Tax=Proteinivorax hydrogeniformans TaxID=1826727 RepID=UPI00338D7349